MNEITGNKSRLKRKEKEHFLQPSVNLENERVGNIVPGGVINPSKWRGLSLARSNWPRALFLLPGIEWSSFANLDPYIHPNIFHV